MVSLGLYALLLSTALLAFFCGWASCDGHENITKECLQAFRDAYSERFTTCRECLQASEGRDDYEGIWRCCSPQDLDCGDLFPHLEQVTEPCTKEDKEALKLDELKQTGFIWADMCAQVNAEPVSPSRPPPFPPFSDTDETPAGEAVTLYVPPSPSVSDRSDEDMCTPEHPGTNPDLCLVFGDPHVIMFGYQEGDMFTCNLFGEVTLFETDQLRVTAQTRELQQTAPDASVPGASIMTSATVAYKDASCGRTQVFDTAGQWFDDRLNTSVIVNTGLVRSGQHYLSVRIVSPFLSGASGICMGKCSGQGSQASSTKQAIRRRGRLLRQEPAGEYNAQAYQECEDEGLTGDFLEACAFDASYSGDRIFVSTTSRDAEGYARARAELHGTHQTDRSGCHASSVSAAAYAFAAACTLLLLL